jgi:hypothetical protein
VEELERGELGILLEDIPEIGFHDIHFQLSFPRRLWHSEVHFKGSMASIVHRLDHGIVYW